MWSLLSLKCLYSLKIHERALGICTDKIFMSRRGKEYNSLTFLKKKIIIWFVVSEKVCNFAAIF